MRRHVTFEAYSGTSTAMELNGSRCVCVHSTSHRIWENQKGLWGSGHFFSRLRLTVSTVIIHLCLGTLFKKELN